MLKTEPIIIIIIIVQPCWLNLGPIPILSPTPSPCPLKQSAKG